MSNLKQRQDIRTKDEFKKDILVHTKKEATWTNKWFQKAILSKHPNAELLDNGCDNTGTVILEKATKEPDFKLVINNKSYLIEAKVSPAPCITLKVYDINHALSEKCKADYYLLVANAEENKDTKYYLVEPSELVRFKSGIRIYSEKFGNKPAIRLFLSDLETFKCKNL